MLKGVQRSKHEFKLKSKRLPITGLRNFRRQSLSVPWNANRQVVQLYKGILGFISGPFAKKAFQRPRTFLQRSLVNGRSWQIILRHGRLEKISHGRSPPQPRGHGAGGWRYWSCPCFRPYGNRRGLRPLRILASPFWIFAADLEFLWFFPLAPQSQFYRLSEHLRSSLRGLYWGSALSWPLPLLLWSTPVDGIQQNLWMLWVLLPWWHEGQIHPFPVPLFSGSLEVKVVLPSIGRAWPGSRRT